MIDIIFQSGEFINPTPGTDWSKWLQAFAGLIAAITGIVTVYYVYRLFKTHDVHKELAKQQIAIVIKLAEQIQKTVMRVEHYTPNQETILFGSDFALRDVHMDIISGNYKSWFGKNDLVLSHEVLYRMDFTKYFEEVLLPKPIAIELKKIHYPNFEKITNENQHINKEDFIYFTVPGGKEFDIFEVKVAPYKIANPELQTVGAYFKQVVKVKQTINQWFVDHGAGELNILT
jgi:hypothetical protein